MTPADVFKNLYGRRQPSAQSHPGFRSSCKSVPAALKAFQARIETILFGLPMKQGFSATQFPRTVFPSQAVLRGKQEQAIRI
ncbi:MAG: hypothetical protein E5X77_12800 [Mesorhizobium sp.]|nr:MAG: hypothetical protein E5X77_12800 [Mesorhizobium sp.]